MIISCILSCLGLRTLRLIFLCSLIWKHICNIGPIIINDQKHGDYLFMMLPIDVTIRKAASDDYQGILDVMRPWNMHHVPSPEMPEIDMNCFFVAVRGKEIVGASGYAIQSDGTAKTTLLGVLPAFNGTGIGKELQLARMREIHTLGVRSLVTNADRPEVIAWYQRNFGYRPIGYVKKVMSFGDPDLDQWTTLQTDLYEFFDDQPSRETHRQAYIEANDPPPLGPYQPLVINVCLTGMIPQKEFTAYVPVHPEEIITQAVEAHDLGASIVHLHARNHDGTPTSNPAVFEQIISGIRRERPDLICCATTSGRGGLSFEERAAVLHLEGNAKPDMASLTLSSLNFNTGPSVNGPSTIERLAQTMKEQGIKPELEIFDAGMINFARYLERHRIIGGTKYFNILLGGISSAPATIHSLSYLVQSLPGNSIWSAAGLGGFQLPMNTISMAAGGHVRVGLEDNVYFDAARTRLATNADLVRRVVRAAKLLERPIASVQETRRLLGLGTTISQHKMKY